MNSFSLELVNEVFILVILPNNNKIILQINQAFLNRDPLQTLFNPIRRQKGLIEIGLASVSLRTKVSTNGKHIFPCHQ